MAKQANKPRTEEDVVSYAQKLISHAQEGLDQEQVLTHRAKCINYRKGNHKIKMRPDRYGNQVWNKFGQIAQERVAHICSRRPKWRFMPRQEAAIFSAEALNDIVGNFLWDLINWRKKGKDSVNEGFNAGSAHTKVIVRPDGFPDAIPRCANQILIDPAATTVEDRRFWIDVYPMNVTEVKQTWGKDVNAESIIEQVDRFQKKAGYFQSGDDKAPSEVFKDDKGHTSWASRSVGMALVWEVWSGDNEYEPIPFELKDVDEEHEAIRTSRKVKAVDGENHPKHIKEHEKYLATLEPELDVVQISTLVQHLSEHQSFEQTEKRKKYPYGRKTVICQGKLMEDGPNPFAETMKNPIDYNDLLIKWDYDKVTDEYWAKSGGHDLFDPQDAINHRKNAITQMINRMNHGVKTMLTRSFDSLRGSFKKLNNLIGTIIPVRNHDDFKIDFGPPFPPQIFQDEYHTEDFMDKLAHQTGILGGNLPKGSPAGVTVNQLLSQSNVPIDDVVENYAVHLQQLARVLMALAIEFIPPETKFRIIDDKRKWEFINWSELGQEMGKYDIHIDIDSMLSTSRQERTERAVRLYESGIYDRQAVLEKLDDPDKYETMQRMSEILLLQQENEMLKGNLDKVVNEYERLDQNYRAAQEKIAIKESSGSKDKKD